MEISYGIIPLRQDGVLWQVLLIQHQAGHWSFPKGHTEPGELPEETAARELYEETGLLVYSAWKNLFFEERYRVERAGKYSDKTVGYFVAIVTGEVVVQVEEIKDYKWLSLDAAYEVLSFEQTKQFIAQLQRNLPVGNAE